MPETGVLLYSASPLFSPFVRENREKREQRGTTQHNGPPVIDLTDDNDGEDSDFYAGVGVDWKGITAECTDNE